MYRSDFHQFVLFSRRGQLYPCLVTGEVMGLVMVACGHQWWRRGGPMSRWWPLT